MKRLETFILCCFYFIIFYAIFILLTTCFMKVVDAIPLINRTNPYYERHLEHINSI